MKHCSEGDTFVMVYHFVNGDFFVQLYCFAVLSLNYISSQDIIHIGVLYSQSIEYCFNESVISEMVSTLNDNTRIHWKTAELRSEIAVTKDVCDLLEDDVHGIVSLLDPKREEYVGLQTTGLGIPHMSIDISAFPVLKSAVHLASPIDVLIQLFDDILSQIPRSDTVVIFDEIIGPNERELFTQALPGSQTWFTSKAFMTNRRTVHVQPQISMIPCPNITNYLFIGRAEIWTTFIKMRMDLLEDNFFWTVISDVSPEKLRDLVKHSPLSNVVISREDWRQCLTVAGHFGSKHIDNTVLNILESTIKEVILSLTRTISDQQVFFSSPCSMFIRHSNSSVIKPLELPCINPPPWEHRYSLYSTHGRNPVTVELVGRWNPKSRLTMETRAMFLNTFYDFGSDPILIAATEAPPFITRVKDKHGNITYVGFSVDIMDELANQMKFSYTIIEPADNFYGARNPDGTWNGMVGMVYTGGAEMAIGPFTITALRDKVIDFTIPFSEGSTGIITLSPGVEGNKSLFQTMKPFSIEVWFTLLASIFIVGLISYLANRFTPYGREKKDRPYQAKYETSLGDNIWMVYSSVTEQGIQHSPEPVSARCVLGLWWLFTILLVATYTANLAAFLTVSLPPPPINTLGELLAQDKIQPIVQAGTSFETIFKEATTDLYREAWSRMQKSPQIPVQSEILDLVRQGDYAYVGDRPLLDYIASNSCLTYSVADGSFDTVGYGMVIPENAPYADTINSLIMKMQEGGLMEKWRQKWWAPSSLCLVTSAQSVNSLDLDSLGGLFISYAIIVCIAFVWQGIEIFSNSKCKTTEGATYK